MRNNWLKDAQKAQGMVEFALVLPVLLLIILGIIGFGHLFFSYSAVVSASREAARFGAAVGVTANNLPHFRDCDEIRTMAINAGRFAGVVNTAASVRITYDEGPGTEDPDAADMCPVDGIGPDVALGDRINVDVTVNYHSIVPIVNIPSFDLHAVTRRTIVRGLAVGEVPTTEPLCTRPTIAMTINPTHSVVGEPVEFRLTVSASPTAPTGVKSLYLFDSTFVDPLFYEEFNAPTGTYTHTYMEAGDYTISGQYMGEDGPPCFRDAAISNQFHIVNAAETNLAISYPLAGEEFSILYHQTTQIPVTVHLGAVAPGSRASWLNVIVTIRDKNKPSNSCQAILDASGTGTCPLTFTKQGTYELVAEYAGDTNYQLDTEQVVIDIIEVVPTIAPTSTSAPPPSVDCPYIETQAHLTSDGIEFSLINRPNVAVDITSVSITWPYDKNQTIANLTEVRFDYNYLDVACGDGDTQPNCMWKAASAAEYRPPTSYTLPTISNGSMPADTWENTYMMRFVFSYPLASITGDYTIRVGLNQSCPDLVTSYTNR